MTAKAYLSQLRSLQSDINSKLEQVESLQALATKTNAVLSHVPSSPTRNVHSMEDVIAEMVDLKHEIISETERLVKLRRSIADTIKKIGNPTYRRVLEMRYLCSKPWEDIAETLGYTLRHTFRVHGDALQKVVIKYQ